MDPSDTLWLDGEINDCLREGGYRRDRSKGYREPFCTDVLKGIGYNEDTGDDIRRRERMAEAMYEV